MPVFDKKIEKLKEKMNKFLVERGISLTSVPNYATHNLLKTFGASDIVSIDKSDKIDANLNVIKCKNINYMIINFYCKIPSIIVRAIIFELDVNERFQEIRELHDTFTVNL